MGKPGAKLNYLIVTGVIADDTDSGDYIVTADVTVDDTNVYLVCIV